MSVSGRVVVVEYVFSIVIGWWIGQLEFLDCRPVTSGEKGHFCKDVFKIFEILEYPFLSEIFKKISSIKYKEAPLHMLYVSLRRS